MVKDKKPYARRDVLLKAAGILLQRKEELIGYMQEETGAERRFAEFQVASGINLIKDVAGKISSISGSIPTLLGEEDHGLIYKEPFGAILAIAPWYVFPGLRLSISYIEFAYAQQEWTLYSGRT